MIFIANTLVMNGGSTFLLRLTQEMHRRGRRCVVLLLTERCDPDLRATLERHADLLQLRDFQLDRGRIGRGLLGCFMPLRDARLAEALSPYGHHVHAMSIFGMLVGMRIAAHDLRCRLTIGIYHQNEFVYRAPPFYFAREMQRLFGRFSTRNLIFFNESSRANYTAFFDRDYAAASLLPIGVALNEPPAPAPPQLGRRIVSIGNLVGFKTYNRHMIAVVAALRDRFPDLRYDIYGTGPMLDALVALSRRLDVADRVTFHGMLDYAHIREAVAECDLFVGSGTALVEAAAIGRPALIGVESMETPETYGYLCNIEGFSYNEKVEGIALQPIETLVADLFADAGRWHAIADACQRKAQDFSIKVTADGFEWAGAAADQAPRAPHALERLRLALSATLMHLSHRLGRSESFGDRRNQSY